MSQWLIIAIVGVGTFLTRLSFIGILGRSGVPAALERPLRFVAPAVLAAIILPELIVTGATIDVGPGNLRLLAAALAAVVAVRTRAIGPTIVSGMAALWLLEWIF